MSKVLITKRVISKQKVHSYLVSLDSYYRAILEVIFSKTNTSILNDVSDVYICEEHRTNGIKKLVLCTLYFQTTLPHLAYKYIDGLEFLVPVNNLDQELVTFIRGGYEAK